MRETTSRGRWQLYPLASVPGPVPFIIRARTAAPALYGVSGHTRGLRTPEWCMPEYCRPPASALNMRRVGRGRGAWREGAGVKGSRTSGGIGPERDAAGYGLDPARAEWRLLGVLGRDERRESGAGWVAGVLVRWETRRGRARGRGRGRRARATDETEGGIACARQR